ncbi:MAG TPA: 1,4-alpha-glucan branching protein domain-containing protein [Solirubrobacteraceae bacterium]|jgi:1,4-alpha-glucan branching enzyme
MPRPGELAIVLHTHMPYVEGGGEWPPPDPAAHLRSPQGFGAWPFGEEWLWEAIATSYIPLLDVLGRAPLTLSLTPVLCDQLEDTAAMARCQAFLDEVRPASHELDAAHFRARGEPALVTQLERSAAEYASAAERLRYLAATPGGLLCALGAHAGWTSAATHAVLPLLASDAGVALQLESGIASHRRRFQGWDGGFWLPECGYAPWLDESMEEAGVASSCVELTGLFGLGDPRHLEPLRTEAGPVLWPVDRQTMALVWSERGYPSAAAYRSYHGQTPRDHRVWRNDGAPYDPAAAAALVAAHASDFVASVKERVRDGGMCVCALDTELLGHWWYEGVRWLDGVVNEAARQGLELSTLDDALERHRPVAAPDDLGVSSWGEGGDLRTWSAPAVADLAWQARTAELHALALGRRPSDRALRELLALQASDWAFQITRELTGDYPRQRAHAHAQALQAALKGQELDPELRNLAPDLAGRLG